MVTTTLYWDCETRSTVDLRKAGVYVYARHPTTSVTVARLAIDREPPHEWRPGQELPGKYVAALRDPDVRVVAHNAAFERIMLEQILGPRHGWPQVPLRRWDCTMARARIQALPGSLDKAAQAAGLDVKKDGSGHALMLRMCRPRAFLTDGSPVWWEDEDRMRRLSDYCSMDVKVERALDISLQPMPPREKTVWVQTEIMNDRGVRFDLSFVAAARVVAEDTRVMLDARMSDLTGKAVARASMVQELKRYLIRQGVDLSQPPGLQREGYVLLDERGPELVDWQEEEDLPDLRRRDVIRLLADPSVGAHAKDVLSVRLEAGKISTRKLDAIAERSDAQGVVQGLLGYHGATTGRYISHGLQVQNFPREVVSDWDEMRTLLDYGTLLVDALAGPPLTVISRMLRGAIIPRPGHEVASGDYSSVEAVGVAWLAGETELLDGFARKAKVYEDMAGRVFNLAPASIAPDSWQRQVGKTLVLGAGYQMGWWKFRETVLLMGGILLTPEVARHAVTVYRETFPRIPRLWRALQNAAMAAVRTPGIMTSVSLGPIGSTIAFLHHGKWLRMRLPSGRYLWYSQPLIEPGKYDAEALTYMGTHPKSKKWERLSTYGGHLTENAVQGLCRDLLVGGTLALEAEGYRPIALVHDEAVCEPPVGHGSIGEMLEILCARPGWAAEFPLSAKGRRGPRYSK